ncbi:MAG: thiamine phosphate synthase [Deltaproteobacteria bacterium]|nr:thiamine phosphate synthase [Deltaproteobacteria bacterium]
MSRGLPGEVALVLVADAPTVGAARLVAQVAAILEAVPPGSVLVIERDGPASAPASDDAERFARLRALRELTAACGAALVVSARVDLALGAGADGVQLPEGGLDAATVRRHFPGLRVGRSCHDAGGLTRAALAGADWATLAPVWAPLSKTGEAPPLELAGFEALARGAALPVVALGGVRAERCAALRRAGAGAVASVGGVFDAPSPAAAARAMIDAWRGAGPAP